jgi:hypothetical protein
LSARCRFGSLALAVALIIAAGGCETDELFTPMGTVRYATAGGLVFQSSSTQGNQIMSWIFDEATIGIEGQGSFAFIEAGPCQYIENVGFRLEFDAFCGIRGYTFNEGTYQGTISATVSEIHLRRACRPQLLDGDDQDGDGVLNEEDNCQLIRNEDQADINGDGFGDACSLPDSLTGDLTIPDRDGDLIADFADNCLWLFNRDQTDADTNTLLRGIGDACEREATVELGPRPPLTVELPVEIVSRASDYTFVVIDFDSNPGNDAPAIECTPEWVTCTGEDSDLDRCWLNESRITVRLR